MTQELEGPQGWGQDPLSDFIEAARRNTLGTFVTQPDAYRLLANVDAAFRKAIGNVSYSEHWLPAVFLLRAHSCFLGAARLAVSGQLAEAYMVLRGCIEASLYAHFLFRDPGTRGPIWFNRHESGEAFQLMRNTFTHRAVLSCLSDHAGSLAERVEALYDRTIDYGGHPNNRGLLQSMGLGRTASRDFKVSLNYLVGDCPAYQSCLRSVCQIGLVSLEIFTLVFHERFSPAGLPEDLESVSEDVDSCGNWSRLPP